jgi:uncharacterized protein YfaS (alpha-2-macroglobulin family)
MQGTRGAIRTGGDGAAPMQGEKPTQEPLARYSGVVKVGSDGTAKVDFDLPAFNGSVRVMGVAWSARATGQASADVIIRDQIVAQATLPRFLAIGDQSRFHLADRQCRRPRGPIRRRSRRARPGARRSRCDAPHDPARRPGPRAR